MPGSGPFDNSSVINFPETEVFPNESNSFTDSLSGNDCLNDLVLDEILSTPPRTIHERTAGTEQSPGWVDGDHKFTPDVKEPLIASLRSSTKSISQSSQTDFSLSPSMELLLSPVLSSPRHTPSRVQTPPRTPPSSRRSLVFSPSITPPRSPPIRLSSTENIDFDKEWQSLSIKLTKLSASPKTFSFD
ncbi:hypothetical protein P9112_007383 [Eukaryota sp. TZLM1-RC]